MSSTIEVYLQYPVNFYYSFRIIYSPSDRADYDQKHPSKKAMPPISCGTPKANHVHIDMIACTLSVKWEMCFDTIMAKPNYFS